MPHVTLKITVHVPEHTVEHIGGTVQQASQDVVQRIKQDVAVGADEVRLVEAATYTVAADPAPERKAEAKARKEAVAEANDPDAEPHADTLREQHIAEEGRPPEPPDVKVNADEADAPVEEPKEKQTPKRKPAPRAATRSTSKPRAKATPRTND